MSCATLKWIAFILMAIDHIGFFFPSCKIYVLLRMIGRLAAPIFFFCFVEGYNHTSNKKKYRNRLLYTSICMMIINFTMIVIFDLLKSPLPNNINPLEPNVIFTLFIMFLILEGIDNRQYWKLIFIISVPLLEYSVYAFNTILIFRYIKNKWIKFLLFSITNICIAMITNNYIELFMVFSSLFLLNYNGEKGKFHSKIFYVLYPLHFYLIKFISIF